MNKKGFTLIELLAVIIILGLIALIIFPKVNEQLEKSRQNLAKDSALSYTKAIDEYIIHEQMNKNIIKLNGIYYIDDSGNIYNNETHIINVSGKKPTSGILTYENDELKTGCITINNYKVTINDNETTVEKGECEYTLQTNFAEDSWSKIKTNLQKDKTSYDSDLIAGTTKDVWVDLNANGIKEDSELFAVRLANTSTPNECKDENFSQSACGVVIEFADIISKHVFNNGKGNVNYTNEGGWPAIDTTDSIYTYINGEGNSIYNLLEKEVRDLIIPTKTISGHGNQEGAQNYISIDKLYLFSTTEVWPPGEIAGIYNDIRNDSALSVTRLLDYYEKNSAKANDSFNNAARKKYNGDTTNWWLRTAQSESNKNFYNVNPNGLWYNIYSNYNFGVSPAFRIME